MTKAKIQKSLGQAKLEKRTLEKWNEKGTKISDITNIELQFAIHIIAHKIQTSSKLNTMLCEEVDLAYKVVKNNLYLDLGKIQLKQFIKNMESIRKYKNNPYAFGSLLTYLFFYVQKFFPSKGTIAWRKDVHVLY